MELFKKSLVALVIAGTMAQSAEAGICDYAKNAGNWATTRVTAAAKYAKEYPKATAAKAAAGVAALLAVIFTHDSFVQCGGCGLAERACTLALAAGAGYGAYRLIKWVENFVAEAIRARVAAKRAARLVRLKHELS